MKATVITLYRLVILYGEVPIKPGHYQHFTFSKNQFKVIIKYLKLLKMKPIKIPALTVMMLVFTTIFIQSCQKDLKETPMQQEERGAASSHRPDDPGFAENNMVMYWNEKTSTVLGSAMIQPNRTRFFAIVQIAVHDALNSIKPKYERFALNEREQFANPDAAVASAAYWAIKGLNRQGSFPIDTWYNESLATIPD